MKAFLFLFSALFALGCTKKELSGTIPIVKPGTDTAIEPVVNKKTYLALGDSYTIGQSVSSAESYPYQLVKVLNDQKLDFASPTIIARTGWTTGDLKQAISSTQLNVKYDLVTLLIGVNNQYRGYSKEDYRREFVELLTTALKFAGGNKSLIYVISIPDWGVTTFGRGSNKNMEISMDIDAFNAINKAETLKMDIAYIDITPESRQALNNDSLIASDGLHPSGTMYADWVKMLSPEILKVLK